MLFAHARAGTVVPDWAEDGARVGDRQASDGNNHHGAVKDHKSNLVVGER